MPNIFEKGRRVPYNLGHLVWPEQCAPFIWIIWRGVDFEAFFDWLKEQWTIRSNNAISFVQIEIISTFETIWISVLCIYFFNYLKFEDMETSVTYSSSDNIELYTFNFYSM